jgi:tetratricopeptide (TPR) repeat protein
LLQALSQDPKNGYAHRNLAAVLGNLGDYPAAIEHFRKAVAVLPRDQQALYGLAQALEDSGGNLEEADSLYQEALAVGQLGPIAELARQARSRIAQRNLRTAGAAPRMDAVMYCLSALERFEAMTPQEVQSIALEIAILGRQGLQVNDPDVTYTLDSLSGEFTGLHLMSMMYVAFKQIAPEYDIGFDLSQEYQSALQLHDLKKSSS